MNSILNILHIRYIRYIRYTSALMTIIWVGIIASSCLTHNEPEESAEIVTAGMKIPEFETTLTDGTPFSSDELKGEVAVITFFTLSCPDCRKYLPTLQSVYARYADQDESPRFICISRGDNEESVKRYWEEQHFTLPVAADPSAEIYHKFARSIVPRTYIANSQGIVTACFTDSPLPRAEELLYAISAAKAP